MVVDRADAVSPGGLGGRRDHHLPALRAPYGLQSRHPAQAELVRVVETIARFEPVAGFFDRLFLRAYSGSGLLIVCWGRLSTMPWAFRCSRTVSYSTRMPVCSAMWSARRLSVHNENGSPRLLGRRLTACTNRSRYSAVTLRGAPGCGTSRSPSTPSAR